MFLMFVNRSLTRQFRQKSEPAGLQAAAQATLATLHIALDAPFPLAEAGPQLIVSNHPTSIDGLIVLAQLARPDTYMLAMDANRVFGPVFTQQMLPVYMSHQPKHHWIDWLRVPIVTFMEGRLSRQEAMARNRQAITQATQLLQQGHCVIIFPGGSNVSESQPWKKGLGYLLAQVQDSRTKITLHHIHGHHWSDSLRPVLPPIILKFLPLHTLKIQTQTLAFDEINHHNDPRVIAREVESIYRSTFSDQV